MSEPPSARSSTAVGIHAAVAVICLVLIGIRLFVPRLSDPAQVAVLALLGTGSALFVWFYRGGPPWTGSVAKVAFVASVVVALGTIVFTSL